MGGCILHYHGPYHPLCVRQPGAEKGAPGTPAADTSTQHRFAVHTCLEIGFMKGIGWSVMQCMLHAGRGNSEDVYPLLLDNQLHKCILVESRLA